MLLSLRKRIPVARVVAMPLFIALVACSGEDSGDEPVVARKKVRSRSGRPSGRQILVFFF